MTILAESIALGLILSLYLSETVGFIAGGLVVPGYIAIILDEPRLLLGTLVASFLTFFIIKIASKYALIYGRRRLLLCVIIGFFFSQLTQFISRTPATELLIAIRAFGFIIPGLMAYWMDKQGIVPTLSMLAVVSTFTRFILILIHRGDLVL